MQITGLRTGNILSATLHAKRLDGASIEDFIYEVQNLMDDGDKSLILDLHGVTYTSSTGLRSLLLLAKLMRNRGGRLVVHSLTRPVLDVVRITGFDRVFEVVRDEREARSLVNS